MTELRIDPSLREGWSWTDAGWSFTLPSGWNQGRSVFGGLSVAAVAALVHRDLEPGWVLRTMSTQFSRPLSPGVVHGVFRELRRGRTVRFFEARLIDGEGEVALTASLVFSCLRDDAVRVNAPSRWPGPDPEGLAELPYLEDLTPEFTQHVAFRWADGGLPYSGAEAARYRAYGRFRVPAGGPEGVLAFLDAWPCPSLSVLDAPAAASTVHWSAHLLEVPEHLEGWLAFEYVTLAGAGGFHTSQGILHGADGRLVALSEQLVAVFA